MLDALAAWARDGDHTTGLPGRRVASGAGGRTAVLSPDVLAVDVIAAGSAVHDAERLYAEAAGAREAIFTTCGPAMHHVAPVFAEPGRAVLIARDLHRSVVTSLVAAGARPVWLPPRSGPPPLADIETAIENDPAASAVVIMTPNWYGAGADVRAIAAACHRRGIPLLVDESMGAHLAFHPALPTPAIRAGADVVTHSVQRSGGGQASAVLAGGLADPARLRSRLEPLAAATSPLGHRSIDQFRHLMTHHGRRLLDAALARAERLRGRLAATPGLTVLDEKILAEDGVAEWDPLTVVVEVAGLDMTGGAAKEWLREHEHLSVRVGDARRVVVVVPYAENGAQGDRIAQAFATLAGFAASTGGPV